MFKIFNKNKNIIIVSKFVFTYNKIYKEIVRTVFLKRNIILKDDN